MRPNLSVLALSAALVAQAHASSYISVRDLAKRLGLDVQAEDLTQRYLLSGQGNEVVLCPGISRALINGRVEKLSAPTRLRRGELEASDDLRPRLEEKLRQEPKPAASPWAGRPPRIFLDPGHGGKDFGAFRRYTISEKALNLDLALRLKRLLEAKGCEVILSRSRDVFVSLDGRVALANDAKPDVFLSMHANSTPGQTAANGFETWYVDDKTSTRTKGVARLAAEFPVYSLGQHARGDAQLKTILCRGLYEDYRVQSKYLAQCIQRGLSKHLQSSNRGAKNHHGLRVLRGVMCPRALVEVGFISNPKWGRKLNSPWYRQTIAKGLAAGLLEFVHAQQKWRQQTARR